MVDDRTTRLLTQYRLHFPPHIIMIHSGLGSWSMVCSVLRALRSVCMWSAADDDPTVDSRYQQKTPDAVCITRRAHLKRQSFQNR